MIARELIDTADIPGGGQLRLIRRGRDHMIMLGGNELMSSRLSGSEEALATLGCGDAPADGRILIGGLGMGFTLRAALALLGPAARITVAEIVPEVIAWGRGPLADLFAGSLDDPRVALATGDVAVPIRAARGAWDAILLDVDNGPDGLVRAANDGLYGAAGLAAARAALRPGGTLAVWSSAPDPRFTRRLEAAGFAVRPQEVRANGARGGARHIIWLARTPG
ncbi:spermidine synthase [Sphingomonas profundi]|uniref:spermidine synthase n=1 Tax=Alterirhizorhabdus profundi TaxID=2681549 RepID=UPI0012E769C5|nr:spermidine synthase [Sphingomonas profundi]